MDGTNGAKGQQVIAEINNLKRQANRVAKGIEMVSIDDSAQFIDLQDRAFAGIEEALSWPGTDGLTLADVISACRASIRAGCANNSNSIASDSFMASDQAGVLR
jgi:hypothetical protein